MADFEDRCEERLPDRVITYRTGPTAALFHSCTAGVKGVMGPIGSGKSVMCCWDIWMKSCTQIPDPETKERVSKWMIVRNTFAQLQKTTIQTWLHWFPNTRMHNSSPITGEYRFPHPSGDGTTVVIKLEFRALELEKQITDLLSLEVTGCWFNEAREIDFNLIQNAKSRLDRYPPSKPWLGYYPVQDLGVIMDTNPGSEENWWYRKAEIEKPAGWKFFRQPPGVLKIQDGEGRFHYEANRGQCPGIPKAENCENYTSGFDYYTKKIPGADDDWIKVYLMGEYGQTRAGKPVYTNYSDALHFHDGDIEPAWGLPLLLGTDFGRTPATIIGQMMPDGQFVIYDEVCGKDMGIIEFCQCFLLPRLANDFKLAKMEVYNFADPAGATGNEIDNVSCIQMMNQCGIPTEPCPVPGNSPYLRHAAVDEALRRRVSGGKPGIVISGRCKMLRAGFLGKYCYRKISKGPGDEMFAEKVDKSNPWSHPHDGLQYLVYGGTHQGGEGAFDVGARVNRAAMDARFGMTQGYGVVAPVQAVRPANAGFGRYDRRTGVYERGVGAYERAGRFRLRMAGYC